MRSGDTVAGPAAPWQGQLFQNVNPAWHLPPQASCAPVLTGGPRRAILLTDDPDLHLLVDGERLDSVNRQGGMYAFRLPGRPGEVRIVSRSASPQELGLARDPRVLGVALRRVVLAQARRQRSLDANAPALTEGFHGFEPDGGLRWTDGDATLPAALFESMRGPAMLMRHLAATTQYQDDGQSARAA